MTHSTMTTVWPSHRTKTLTAVIRAAADRPDEADRRGRSGRDPLSRRVAALSLLASKLFVQLLDIAGADVAEERTHRATMREPQLVATASSRSLRQAIHELHATTRLAERARPATLTRGSRASCGSRREAPKGRHRARRDRVEASRGTFRAVVVKNSPALGGDQRPRRARHGLQVLAVWLYQLCALHAGRARVSRGLGSGRPARAPWRQRAPSLQPLAEHFKRYVLEPACAEINQLTGDRRRLGADQARAQGHGRAPLDLAQGRRRDRRGRRRACPPPGGPQGTAQRAGRADRRGARRLEPRDRGQAGRAAPTLPGGRAARSARRPTPRQIGLEEAIAAAGVRLTAAQLMLGAEAARAEGGAQFDVQAVYADWLRAAAQRKDPLRNPAGHWIDFCKRRVQ